MIAQHLGQVLGKVFSFPGEPPAGHGAGAAGEEKTASGPGIPPDEALLPFRPGVDGPWDRAAAAHLARRAAFGMPDETVTRLARLEPRAAAQEILRDKPENEDVRFASGMARQVASLDAAQASWVYRMLHGSSPATEKLTLFWHGHFATSERKVENAPLMLRQIELFRSRGAGPFEDLLAAVARDPAMLIWLDSNSNRKGKPNENFARELMELFSLGIGNYSEDDIKEAARAFTGWHVKQGELWFNERAHDAGEKTVFGKAGAFGGDDIVRMCVEKPASAEFIAVKLFEHYVHLAPPPQLRRELGQAYAASGRRTGEFLAALLASRVFYSPWARRALVSTPADFAVGSLRTLGARANTKAVASAMAAMGQELLAPPSVKGWDMGPAWLSSTTLLARYRFAMGTARTGDDPGGKELAADVAWGNFGADPDAIIARFFPEGLPAAVAANLRSNGGPDPKVLAGSCMQLPEYQFV